MRSGLPRFTGLTSSTDPQGRYEFRHPAGWVRSALDHDLDGVIVRPEPDDEATYFAVAVTDLQVPVVADDLAALRGGFDAGISRLADLSVEHTVDTTYNEIIKLERTFTFAEDGATRRRRVWVLYADHWQFVVAFQGSTVEEYDYWLPMGNSCFTAFELPQALWFATDPTVSDPESPATS